MSSTFDRVPAHTSEEINQQIQNNIRKRVRHLAVHPDAIPRRLENSVRNGISSALLRRMHPHLPSPVLYWVSPGTAGGLRFLHS